MMRNPMSRKMFANPQQRRQMSRMPSGILASGPNVIKAVNGMSVDLTGKTAPGITPNASGLGIRPNASGPGIIIPDNSTLGGLIVGATSPVTVQEGADVGEDVGSSSTIDDTRTNAKVTAPVLPKPKKPQGNLPDPSKKDPIDFGSLSSLLTSLKEGDGKKKTTKQYIDESKALLEEYGIEAPDLKSRRDMRIMEFFLNVAAGQSPDAATNIADAAKTSVKGYGEDVRDIEATEQKLALAGIEMGMSAEARDEASTQAILLKKYDIAADVFKKINDLPDKSQQIQVLMDTYGVGQEDALKMVYPGRTSTSQYGDKRQDLIDDGHSALGATYLAIGGATLLGQLADGTSMIGDQLAKLAKDQGVTLTPLDKSIFNIPSDDIDLTS